ncbi:MAG: heme lyase CcmF/NrfE family subunit [Chloroflexi bacterium]|jgi:cytochrome c-type biogenesis protein CcmF|nr:heme lyase CcmF/NrfE family subunit [Chloroflexota bacterium]MBT3669272.1 heme lyase CcmF/NrfE family subunit [Chloroflexota bacterium]MBT4003097.1 heme lyase CcmF/NrfE family subunit [Chloroflexota bacterium]MBT4305979.1 heme lyase CcmF/NrfE family subunit [Chloroflexota bacterium]MBT4532623.1 heme lyase CcmF/NrfE family subunit [Chloroflexota bacterium]
MTVNIGYGALVLTFIVSLYAIGAAIYGERNKKPRWVDSARNAMVLIFPLLTISAGALILLLVNNDFQVEYVASVTSRSMPTYLRVTALWGGQPGSLLFWSWLMAGFASAVTLRKWDRDREFLPWVIVVTLATLVFFLLLVVFYENPFVRMWQTPVGSVLTQIFQPTGSIPYVPGDGRGLNPLLRHPGMIIHPPLLYLGFVAFVIPFAFAIAALITGRTDDRWIRITRRWTLWAWLFLSLGLILGGRWAYDVLGWGGYWAWDPVEISALLPWLAATPFLHSVMIQEKRGMLKHWNMLLIIFTYDLMIFGTFLTRSGVLSSVHSFAQSAIGPLFFAFIGVTLIVSLYLLSRRWDELKAEAQFTSWLSRESLFMINNLLFVGILVVCFWGMIFPLISEIFTGQKVTVGPVFYENATGPLWLALLFLMGVAPLSAWRASTAKSLGRNLWKPAVISFLVPIILLLTGMISMAAILTFWMGAFVFSVTLYEFYKGAMARHKRAGENFFVALWTLMGRNRRRYGGYIIHLGVIFMAVGIIGLEVFQTETQGSLALGESLELGPYTMVYTSLSEFDTDDNRNVARAVVEVYEGDEFLTELYPRKDFFYESQQPMTIPGVRSTMEDDFYVIMADWKPITTKNATFKVYHNPLVNWLWVGSIIFILGTFVAAWPEKEDSPKRAKKSVSASEKV